MNLPSCGQMNLPTTTISSSAEARILLMQFVKKCANFQLSLEQSFSKAHSTDCEYINVCFLIYCLPDFRMAVGSSNEHMKNPVYEGVSLYDIILIV